MSLNILLLCNKPSDGSNANTIVDHIEAFENYSEHTIWLYSNLGDFSKKLDLNKFDGIIIHYSLFVLSRRYLTRAAKKQLRDYKGLKTIFIQDEYRQINHMVDELAYLGIDVLFTCFPESEFDNIYSPKQLSQVSKHNNLTGYVPKRLTEYTNQPPISGRSVHVGYRGRKLAYWYGALGCEKWEIAEKWHQYVSKNKLNTDISCQESERIYGDAWIQFLSSCKTTLGVESGASVMDFTGKLEKKVELYQFLRPSASFKQVQEKYFLNQENLHNLNQISPRCFEAIALKTVLVLYEGDYSGILIPGRHYIALKKDYSNIKDVLALIQDDAYLQNMADTAYEEIALNPLYSYQVFIQKVDAVLQDEFKARQKTSILSPYEPALFEKHIQYGTLYNTLLNQAINIYRYLPLRVRQLIKSILSPHRAFKYILKGLLGFKSYFKKTKKETRGVST
ncbi:MAG: hypothetical protein K0U24_07270 [Gammaproteobacteria bacterium]|nr:hypothetical protein [Gammaproteobacteria bacterium]MCH9764002.1 hypothetical protein [Gammaproteobacteria bacterium]